MADYSVTPTYTETMREVVPTDKVIASFVNSYLNTLFNNDAYMVSRLDAQRSVSTMTLNAGAWQGASAPYSYTISLNGITANDNPVISINIPALYTAVQAKAASQAFNCITRGTTAANTITLYCDRKLPTVDIPIAIKGR